MCLYINSKSIKELFGDKKRKTFWKVLRSDFKSIHQLYLYVAGINKSDRIENKLTCNEKRYGIVNKGIHVYTTKKEALKSVKCPGRILVPVICHINDLVAFGDFNEAVFTKVRLEQRTIDRINKRLK